MKLTKQITATVLIGVFVAGSLPAFGQEAKDKPKPYTLDTCAVSDEKLGSMGEAHVFTHEGREIKLCCKSCLKTFNKEPAKHIKKIEEAEKKAADEAAKK
jgi:hypothetical protein